MNSESNCGTNSDKTTHLNKHLHVSLRVGYEHLHLLDEALVGKQRLSLRVRCQLAPETTQEHERCFEIVHAHEVQQRVGHRQ